jgi:hypothetical protein
LQVAPSHSDTQCGERLTGTACCSEEARSLIARIREIGLCDVERDAGGSADELISEGAVMPLDARNERTKRGDHFEAQLCDLKCHGFLLPLAQCERPTSTPARAGRVQAAGAAGAAKRLGLEAAEHAGTMRKPAKRDKSERDRERRRGLNAIASAAEG